MFCSCLIPQWLSQNPDCACKALYCWVFTPSSLITSHCVPRSLCSSHSDLLPGPWPCWALSQLRLFACTVPSAWIALHLLTHYFGKVLGGAPLSYTAHQTVTTQSLWTPGKRNWACLVPHLSPGSSTPLLSRWMHSDSWSQPRLRVGTWSLAPATSWSKRWWTWGWARSPEGSDRKSLWPHPPFSGSRLHL